MATLSAGSSSGRMGSSFYGSQAIGAGAVTIVAPASNVNGLYLRQVSNNANAAATQGLFAGAAAPTSLTSNSPLAISQGAPTTSVRDCFLPAGQGLYVYANAAGPGTLYISYDLL
jgi:hypothetical protein